MPSNGNPAGLDGLSSDIGKYHKFHLVRIIAGTMVALITLP